MALTVNLRTKEPLRSVFSPTHNATITRKGLTEATASVKAEGGVDSITGAIRRAVTTSK